MTKLIQWLLIALIYGFLYISALQDILPYHLSKENKFYVLISPICIAAAFAVVSVIIILYRVATFNDCEEAAEELKQQCIEARKDLMSKGMKFD